MLTGYGYVMCISIHCCIVCLLISAWAFTLSVLFVLGNAKASKMWNGNSRVHVFFVPICQNNRNNILKLKYKYYGKSS